MKNIRRCIVTLFMLLPLALCAQESNKAKFNAGLKVGFHAATYNTAEFNLDGYTYDDATLKGNRIGYSVTPFVRLSKGRSYLQTEAALSVSHNLFNFTETTPTESTTPPQEAEYKLTSYSIQVPLVYGYNFVQNDTYAMSVFTGPKARFVFTSHDKQTYNNFKIDNLHEELTPVTYYWELGLCVKISKFIFDFTFDVGLNDVSKQMTSGNNEKIHTTKRSENLLSFSVGIIL